MFNSIVILCYKIEFYIDVNRFFKDKEPLKKTAFGEALGEELGSLKVEATEEKFSLKDIKVEEGSPTETLPMPEESLPCSSNNSQSHKSAVKQGLRQAFGFRRLDSPATVLHGTSPLTSKPFKPVFKSQDSPSGSVDSLSQRSLSQKSLNDSQVSVDSEIFNNNSENSHYDSSFTCTPQSQSLSESPCGKTASNYFKKTSPPNNAYSKSVSPPSELKLKAKPVTLKRKCVDIATMFKRVPKKNFLYSTSSSQSEQLVTTPDLSTTPDLPSLPDVLDDI